MDPVQSFELEYKASRIQIHRHSINGQTIFRVIFPDNRKTLVITRPSNSDGARFWTSIPEGRQREAEEIGPLIAAYLQNK
jgi:hypothetical protein